MNQPFVSLVLLVALGAMLFLLTKVFRQLPQRKYKPKGPYLLSHGECRFFDVLAQATPVDIYICPKVRVADLLEVTFDYNDPKHWRYFSAISQKHVDFVLCKRSDFTPLLVIELDGASHREKKRVERDRIVDAAFKDASIPVLHIRASGMYDARVVKEQIMHAIAGQ